MPSTPVNLTFTPLTNPFILFATVDAFNAWVGEITVSIEGGNLPSATVSDQGAVKMAELVVYADAVVVPTWCVIENDEGNVTIPSQADFQLLQAKVDTMSAALALLIQRLQLAGIMADE